MTLQEKQLHKMRNDVVRKLMTINPTVLHLRSEKCTNVYAHMPSDTFCLVNVHQDL